MNPESLPGRSTLVWLEPRPDYYPRVKAMLKRLEPDVELKIARAVDEAERLLESAGKHVLLIEPNAPASERLIALERFAGRRLIEKLRLRGGSIPVVVLSEIAQEAVDPDRIHGAIRAYFTKDQLASSQQTVEAELRHALGTV